MCVCVCVCIYIYIYICIYICIYVYIYIYMNLLRAHDLLMTQELTSQKGCTLKICLLIHKDVFT